MLDRIRPRSVGRSKFCQRTEAQVSMTPSSVGKECASHYCGSYLPTPRRLDTAQAKAIPCVLVLKKPGQSFFFFLVSYFLARGGILKPLLEY